MPSKVVFKGWGSWDSGVQTPEFFRNLVEKFQGGGVEISSGGVEIFSGRGEIVLEGVGNFSVRG